VDDALGLHGSSHADQVGLFIARVYGIPDRRLRACSVWAGTQKVLFEPGADHRGRLTRSGRDVRGVHRGGMRALTAATSSSGADSGVRRYRMGRAGRRAAVWAEHGALRARARRAVRLIVIGAQADCFAREAHGCGTHDSDIVRRSASRSARHES